MFDLLLNALQPVEIIWQEKEHDRQMFAKHFNSAKLHLLATTSSTSTALIISEWEAFSIRIHRKTI